VSPLGWAGFALAAAAGAATRAALDTALARRSARFPLGTLAVNITGSFALGVLVGLSLRHGLGPVPRRILGTGFCGAYTTYGTFAYDTLRLAREHDAAVATRNVVASMVGATAAGAAGLALGMW